MAPATSDASRSTIRGSPIQREPILAELHHGFATCGKDRTDSLYALTDEDPGALLRVEPVSGAGSRYARVQIVDGR